MMYDMIRRTFKYNFNLSHCCLGAESSSPVQWKKQIPSRPVVQKKTYRPVPSKKKQHRLLPSWKKLYTVPSRRQKLYTPFRPVEQIYTSRHVVTIFTYRPVTSWQFSFTVPSRHETKRSLYSTVPSRRGNSHPPPRPIQAVIIFITLPSRPVPSRLQFVSRQACQNSIVPSRLEYYQPWKALVMIGLSAPLTDRRSFLFCSSFQRTTKRPRRRYQRFAFRPIYYIRPSLSLLVVTQIWGHMAGSSPSLRAPVLTKY